MEQIETQIMENKILNYINNFFDQRSKILAFVMLTILFFYFFSKGVMMSADSQSYIQNEIIRSPLYPLLLNGIELLFGKGNFFILPILQLLFGFLSSYWLANFIRDAFKLPAILFLVSLCLLLTPYFFYFGNLILTEGIAYPLFLITVGMLLKSLISNKNAARYYCLFLIALSFLVLTRRQYLFLYVVAFLAFLYHFVYEKTSLNSRMSLLFAFLAAMSVTDLVERSYQYYYNGHFTTVPFLGIQLMTMPLYLSSDKDLNLYSDPKEANILRSARKIMKENRYDTSLLWKEYENPEYPHYYLNYNNVSWGSLSLALAENGIEGWIERDRILKKMYLPLLKAHWKRGVSLYVRNIVHNMGGYYNFIFLWVTFVVAIYFHLKNRDKLSMGIFLAILMTFGNYFSVALVEPAMTRYTFSTNIILVIMLIISSYYALRKYNNQIYTLRE